MIKKDKIYLNFLSLISARSDSKMTRDTGEERGRLSLISLPPSHLPVDLNRLYDDVKWYSCTPRNYSVNLREELRATNAIFFPRCLLVQRCGGNCGCGTDNWNNDCTCRAAKTTLKLHEVGLNVMPVRACSQILIDSSKYCKFYPNNVTKGIQTASAPTLS